MSDIAPDQKSTDLQPTRVPTARKSPLTGTLEPLAGYASCVALVPTHGAQLEIALFVSRNGAHGTVTWEPPQGTRVVDLPAGFSINDVETIHQALVRVPGGRRDDTGNNDPPPIPSVPSFVQVNLNVKAPKVSVNPAQAPGSTP